MSHTAALLMLRGVLSSCVAVSAAVSLAQLWQAPLAAAQPAPAARPAPPAAPSSTPPPPPPVTADTELYTVVAGDSCRSIAYRVLGSAQTINELHRLNPQLGPTPHALVAGQQLRLPRRGPVQPAANLTASRGTVEYRDDKQLTWDPARLGMDLFRAWRVGARSRASAEVTFLDASQLRLRENTVVIIYGPSATRAPATAVRAEIEGGSLEARLAAATTGVASVEVLTPSALAVLQVGRSLFSVDPAGTSLVANHEGAPVAVRAVTRKQPRGNPVSVARGMGSRVEPGKLPEPPRPLPPAPAFTEPRLVVATFAAAGTVPLAWQPAAGAVRYRVVVLDAQGAEQNAVVLPPGATSFELAAVPPGDLRVQVSSIDATGFEGIPTALEVRVVSVAMAPPGTAAPATPSTATPTTASPATTANPATTAPTAPLRVALGARLVAPAGVRCTLEPVTAAPAPPSPASSSPATPAATSVDASLVARSPGRYLARCVAATAAPSSTPGTGTAAPTAPPAASLVDVVPVRAAPLDAPTALPRLQRTVLTLDVTSEASESSPLGALTARGSAGLTVETVSWDGRRLTLAVTPAATADATESLQLATADVELTSVPLAIANPVVAARQPPRYALELGGFAGLVLPPEGSALGSPSADRDELASGPLLGLRLAVRATSRPWLAGRVDLGAAALSQVGTPDTAALLLPSAALAVRPLARGGLELWAFAGAGLARLASAPGSLHTESALTLDGGAGLLVHRAGLAFRLDATWSLVDPGGAAEVWPSFRLGIARAFER